MTARRNSQNKDGADLRIDSSTRRKTIYELGIVSRFPAEVYRWSLTRRGAITCSLAIVGLFMANSSNMLAYGASQNPVLKAIDPSTAKMDTVAQPPAAPSPNPLGGISGSPISSPAGGNYAIQQAQYPAPQMVQPTNYQQQAPSGYSSPQGAPAFPSQNMIPDFNQQLPQSQGGSSGFATQTNGGQTPDEARISRLEQTAFGSTYPEHELDERLDHLEKEVLGNPTSGPPEQRMAHLEVKLGGGGVFAQTPSAPAASAPPQLGLSPLITPNSSQPQMNQMPTAQMPMNQMPVGQQQMNQMPMAQMPMQQPPMNQMPMNQMGMNQMPMNQMPVGQQQMNQMPMAQMPMQQPPINQMPMNQMPMNQMPMNQVGMNQMPIYQMNVAPLQISQTPPVEQMPIAQMPMQSSLGLPSPPPAMSMMAASSNKHEAKAAKAPKEQTQGKHPTDGVESSDYFDAIPKYAANTVIRWRDVPVGVHLPVGSPESWQRSLDSGIKRWNEYLPVRVVSATEPADIEVVWVNRLVPQYLGITRLVMPSGQMKVTVFLLRPTYYLPQIPERVLQMAFLHELGHALGIFGHSNSKLDLMYAAEITPGPKNKPSEIHYAGLSDRDINTLKHIYATECVATDFSMPQPLEWGCKASDFN